MKLSIARKWAAALESDDYKQGTGQLRTKKGSFCCLGVLCNLHAQDHPEIASKEKRKTIYLDREDLPAAEVINWAGLSNENPYIKDHRDNLAGLNDSGGFTFKDIAKIIRKHWKEL